ncbi:glycosyltransferase family 2 protein [Aliarcobacter butzleri]|uniref:glycosyltransferase family 2 protein n=1 Tax=Aliarcobacter butzleri TaxID=28197 RepID=UPI00263C9A94|nr:glycosyltransferase family 2 protein [Aliarcobacter butzleri]MDN5067887.1 glycosyltransferase family 2 protein [Aliarcobacter butzleri]MDN5072711.1 glycosyltransferase family 2 protein [Aliarcobacter butzleri]MDN5121689.1 glycosyltransferase family 2 protein [Aliarcobacter butzleri]
MKYKPLISVVIPMYNAEKYIDETIKSVLNQTHENLEIIVVDNCSTDKSKDIVKNIDEAIIKLIELEYNSGGPARPRNVGVENANGEYIAFLDADDIWNKNKLDYQLKFMLDNKLNFSSTSAMYIDEQSRLIKKSNKIKNIIRKFRTYDLKSLLRYKFIFTSSVLIKKDILKKFNEETNCISVEDYYLWLNLLNNSNTKYGFLHKELLYYRIVTNSVTDRSVIGKQKAKSMMYSLKFIIENNRYELLKCLKF